MIFIQKKQKGFTLIETLTTIFIFSIIMGGTTLLLRNIFQSGKQQPLALEIIDQARIVGSNFTNELRNATYGSDGSYPINRADDFQIIFYSTYDGSANTQTNRIRYWVSGTTLYKGVTAPSGNPLSYDTSSEKTTAIIANISNANVPAFNYYNGDYAGISAPLSQPININDVKFAAVNLILPKQDSRDATSTFSITAGSTIRNLKTNLGN